MEGYLHTGKENSSFLSSDTPVEVSSVFEEKEHEEVFQQQQAVDLEDQSKYQREENPVSPPLSPMDVNDQMNESTLPVVMSTHNSQDQLYQPTNLPTLTPLSIPMPTSTPVPVPVPVPAPTPTPTPAPATFPTTTPYGIPARDMHSAMNYARSSHVRMPPIVPSTNIRFTVITNIVNGELFLVVPSIPEEILREDIGVYNLNGIDLPGWRMMKVEGQYWSKTLTVIQREGVPNLVPQYHLHDERSM